MRLSAKLARAFGMSYRSMWNCLKDGDSGLTVLRVPTRQPQKRLMYIRLADINRALGYRLYAPPTLAGHGPHDSEHMDQPQHDNSKEMTDGDHPKA